MTRHKSRDQIVSRDPLRGGQLATIYDSVRKPSLIESYVMSREGKMGLGHVTKDNVIRLFHSLSDVMMPRDN